MQERRGTPWTTEEETAGVTAAGTGAVTAGTVETAEITAVGTAEITAVGATMGAAWSLCPAAARGPLPQTGLEEEERKEMEEAAGAVT